MAINSDFRGFTAEAAVPRYSIVKAGASGGVVVGAAATDKLLGTSDELAHVTGERVDVALGPLPFVRLGGTVTAGAWLTSNATGAAVATTTTGDQTIGRAEIAGVSGDEITYIRALGQL